MPTVDERLARIERRQEDLIAAIDELATICELTRATVTQLATWMQEPPKSDIGGLIKGLTGALQALQDQVVGLGRRMGDLPADVARAVASGAVH
jgi:hypothetical protein